MQSTADILSKQAPECRVCGSSITAYIRDIPMRRMKRSAPLYYCLECESFAHPHIYSEPPEQQEKDANWHIGVEDRNTGWANKFFDEAVKVRPINSVLEIGCATGTFLSVAKDRRMKVEGFDTNSYAASVAKERHHIDVNTELWDRNTITEKFDLLCSISVLEHLTEPRAHTVSYTHLTLPTTPYV